MIAMEISQEAEWVFSKVLVSGIYCNNKQGEKKKIVPVYVKKEKAEESNAGSSSSLSVVEITSDFAL